MWSTSSRAPPSHASRPPTSPSRPRSPPTPCRTVCSRGSSSRPYAHRMRPLPAHTHSLHAPAPSARRPAHTLFAHLVYAPPFSRLAAAHTTSTPRSVPVADGNRCVPVAHTNCSVTVSDGPSRSVPVYLMAGGVQLAAAREAPALWLPRGLLHRRRHRRGKRARARRHRVGQLAAHRLKGQALHLVHVRRPRPSPIHGHCPRSAPPSCASTAVPHRLRLSSSVCECVSV
jgi:hypothetical protein